MYVCTHSTSGHNVNDIDLESLPGALASAFWGNYVLQVILVQRLG